ncbi:MAG: lipid-A-disaccharide synthase [Betaproteobacteria bacterium]|nr:lipid-A-disaccharide synthase [Betaproteobacteria bacterium]
MIAGEASGDTLGEEIIQALLRRFPGIRLVGIGGPRMIGAGLESWHDQERLAVRGLVEVVHRIPELLRIRKRLVKQLIAAAPKVVIGIDSPDFTLGVERRLKRRGIPTVHCVSPTIWAWRARRIHGIRRAVSHMLTLFPFEEKLYRDAGVEVTCIGHPLADTLSNGPTQDVAREQLRIPAGARVVAILPGSRQHEIEMMAPTFIEVAKRLHALDPTLHFLVPLVTRPTRLLFEERLYRQDANELPISMLYGHAHDAMAAADVVLAASGTATLEAALLGRPVVIAYRVVSLTFRIARMMMQTPFIGLPNILAGTALCPEFLQDDATPENLTQAVLNLLQDKRTRTALSEQFVAIREQLALGAAERAAGAIAPFIERK